MAIQNFAPLPLFQFEWWVMKGSYCCVQTTLRDPGASSLPSYLHDSTEWIFIPPESAKNEVSTYPLEESPHLFQDFANLEHTGLNPADRNFTKYPNEIHADLTFPGHRHFPFANLGPELAQRTITLTSATKASAALKPLVAP